MTRQRLPILALAALLAAAPFNGTELPRHHKRPRQRAAPSLASQPATSGGTSCVQPYCNGRTDRAVIPYPAQIPTWGPAGSIWSDPAFPGVRILRVTDANTDPARPGASFHAASAGYNNAWSADGKQFLAIEHNGPTFAWAFNATALSATKGAAVPGGFGSQEFSFVQPNIVWGIQNVGAPKTIVSLAQADLSTGKVAVISGTGSIPIPASPRWYGNGISCSTDDSRCSFNLGPAQDQNAYVVVWDKALGVRWLNTETWQTGGDWGPVGAVANPPIPAFGVHDTAMSGDGRYVLISIAGGAGANVFWQADTQAMQYEPNTYKVNGQLNAGGGHFTFSRTRFYNSSIETNGNLEVYWRPAADISALTLLVPNQPVMQDGYDKHYSALSAEMSDAGPVCFSTNSNKPVSPARAVDVWENEIGCIEADGLAQTVWRFAHTFSTGLNGFYSVPIGQLSPDGMDYVFSSDWDETLGGGPEPNFRTDVFLVQFAPPASPGAGTPGGR